MYFAKSITILITSIFAVAMANRLMTISRFRQAVVDAIFIRIHQSSRYNRRTNHRTDSFLFHILEHLNCDLSAMLNNPEYRGGSLSNVLRPRAPLSVLKSKRNFLNKYLSGFLKVLRSGYEQIAFTPPNDCSSGLNSITGNIAYASKAIFSLTLAKEICSLPVPSHRVIKNATRPMCHYYKARL
uniref:Uncharacterized protein n=2 Tax=Candidatus Kentrum eta TaxID=2126337 RepID=A0A450UL82_9GAMM|nr:MAG: hypothetical protein BECKH772B_GA0070898_1004117 [Candidatus Kentron sp. H]